MTSEPKTLPGEEKMVPTACCSHCGGQCVLKAYVRDGVITRLETDDTDEPQMRACLRGRSYRQRVYAPDRLLYPMKRVGNRGEGKFQRVSWDEALGTVAGEIMRIRDAYGPASILFKPSGGDISWFHNFRLFDRLLSMAGGYSEVWGFFSFEGGVFASNVSYGTVGTSNTRDDLLNSKLIILWGWNPTDTISHANTSWYLAQAREKGARVVAVDPRYTDTVSLLADQWIPIIPGTDAAMLVAMAYVMITEGFHDQKFLDTHTIGFDKFKNYVLGKEDGVAKTPAWAEAITSVPASTIAQLARDYARMKPAALMAGIAPGRTAYGEQYHRVAITLAAMTGNVGVHGGDAAARAYSAGYGPFPFMRLGRGVAAAPNSVEDVAPTRQDGIPPFKGFFRRGSVNVSEVADAILKGKSGGYPADYKMLMLVNTSFPNQFLNLNKSVEALKSPSLEFVVMTEQFMTPGAKFADILLPTNTFLERNDITIGEGTGFYAFMNQAVGSLGESKSHLDICLALADKLGVKGFNEYTEDEWLRSVVKGGPNIADYDQFRRQGIQKASQDGPYVAFKEQIEDPARNKFPTPSGKIEIYSQRLADKNRPDMPAVPKYIETWESRNDPLAKQYPLQMITSHIKRRAHSQFENIPWLSELQRQAMWIHPADAGSRGIKDGDLARVFNDRGQMLIRAKVTERILPGVVDVPQGAWYNPDANGVDRGGSANVLTRDRRSPGGAFSSNTSLVQVGKAPAAS